MIRMTAGHLKERLRLWRRVMKLRGASPGSTIGTGVQILGDAPRLEIGDGCDIDDGVIFDDHMASIDQREGAPEWVFYDGPPFANGLPHYGHLLTGYVKAAVPR